MSPLNSPIAYRSGYKYQLAEPASTMSRIYPPVNVDHRFFTIFTNGLIVLKTGYAWDGASGPAIDTKTILRGSAFHDAIYQSIKLGILDKRWRNAGDALLHRICKEDGMACVRAWWVYKAVRKAGGLWNKRPYKHRVKYAPYKPKSSELHDDTGCVKGTLPTV